MAAVDARAGRRAFTLLEMLLALAVVVLLLTAGVLALSSLRAGRQLEEGVSRVEGMLRMARADAANLGRRVRVDFDAESGACLVLWEPDPLTQPGTFADYASCTWRQYVPSGMVRVTRCTLVGPSAYRTLNLDAMNAPPSGDSPLQAVTFYPDGSCDSAQIELVNYDGDDTRTAIIDVDGLTGTITTRIETPAESSGA